MTRKKSPFTKQDEKVLLTWKHTKHITDSTYQTYKYIMQSYTEATQMTIKELYDEAIMEEEQRIPRYRKSIKTHFIEYMDYLDTHEYKESTKNTNLRIIKSFYQSLDIELPHLENNYDRESSSSTYEKMITKDLIRQMIHQAGTRDKAILSLAATTGQGRTELSNLTVQDIVDSWNTLLTEKIFTLPDIFKHKQEILELECPQLKIRRQKTGNKYWVYLAPETTGYIMEYLYERVAGRNQYLRFKEFDTPLFVNKMGEKLSSDALGKVFNYIGERCGFENPEIFPDETRLLLTRKPREQRVYSCHKYRKYFLNMCRRHAGTNSETPSNHTYSGSDLGDFWIGHQDQKSINYYKQYDDEDVDEMRIHYIQMLPYLSLEKEIDHITTADKKEFNQMKRQYTDLMHEMTMLKEYIQQKQQVDELAKLYGLER